VLCVNFQWQRPLAKGAFLPARLGDSGDLTPSHKYLVAEGGVKAGAAPLPVARLALGASQLGFKAHAGQCADDSPGHLLVGLGDAAFGGGTNKAEGCFPVVEDGAPPGWSPDYGHPLGTAPGEVYVPGGWLRVTDCEAR